MKKLQFAASALALAGVSTGVAQEKPFTPESAASTQPTLSATTTNTTSGLNGFFNTRVGEALAKGKFSLNVRPRWEHADQSNLKDSDACTIRTRFGYTTAPLEGFQAMVEAENIAVLGPSHNYNVAGTNPNGAGRTVVADPPTTELNQAWLSYTNWNTLAKVGRQRIALDNHRFIGDVGWRQNMQTYDSAVIENKSLPYTALLYGYVWEVNRVFGDVDRLGRANTDFDSDSHVFHFAYNHWKWISINAYSYLLDLENGVATNPNSTATYGAFVNGSVPVHEKVSLDYRAEFAWQTDYAGNAFDYSTEYYLAELGATIKPVQFGAGYQVLGSDEGSGFKTPLATLHAHNGWADVFLNTPGREFGAPAGVAGIRDLYAFTGVTMPYEVPFRVIVHQFKSDSGSVHYGDELDVVISKKFGKHWTALAKYAHFDGKETPTAFDVDKIWAQVEFNY